MRKQALKILLIDDDNDDYVIVRSLLSQVKGRKYKLDWVSTPEEALEAMIHNRYDVYLVDYRLGAYNGLDLLREATRKGCSRPMILLTGQGGHQIDIDAMEAGAADYLMKGQIDTSSLERAIRYAVERAKTLQTLSQQADKLSESNRKLEEKERQLSAFHKIGRVTLSSLDLDTVLDNLAGQIIEAGIFRSVMIALVKEPTQSIEIARSVVRKNKSKTIVSDHDMTGLRYNLSDNNIIAEVARSGKMQIVEGWDERLDPRIDNPKSCGQKVSYFIPVKQSNRTLAVLATNSTKTKQTDTLRQIEIMHPLLDQVAIALEHAKTNHKLKQTQEHLIQWEKIASLGHMAAGIAHEINNPVGFVMGNLQTMDEYVKVFKILLHACNDLCTALQENDKAKQKSISQKIRTICREEDVPYLLSDVGDLISESIEGTQRVKEIVQGLKSFARTDGCDLQEADINAGIENALKIVWNEVKYKCKINKEFGDLPPVRCCPGQLNQVFVNLLINAAQAISKQGEITIRTEATQNHVIIRVTDTGKGIPEHIRSRIFEPFFTTKTVNEGTGLGLAISYSIIHAHKGTIDVRSTEGMGTEFMVKIPKNLEVELVPHPHSKQA